jgi:hypothetical protein
MKPTPFPITIALLRRRVSVSVAIVLLAFAASSCGVAQDLAKAFQPATTTTIPGPFVVSIPPSESTVAGACIDATSSVEDQVRTATFDAITGKLTSLAASEPTANADARPAIPGLLLSMGWMTANGFDARSTIAEAQLGAIEGVIARPTVGVDADRAFISRARAMRDWRAANAVRRDEVNSVVSRLGAAVRPKPHSSDILGCAAARAQRLRGMGAATGRILIVSDMIESGRQQKGGQLDGFDVEIVLICKELELCDSLTLSWTERLLSLGAKDVRVSRLESLPEATERLFASRTTGSSGSTNSTRASGSIISLEPTTTQVAS